MAYIVRVEVGKGKKKTILQSIPLPSKKRVEGHIKKSPVIKSSTKIKVTNTKTKKSVIGTEGRFIQNPFTKKFRF